MPIKQAALGIDEAGADGGVFTFVENVVPEKTLDECAVTLKAQAVFLSRSHDRIHARAPVHKHEREQLPDP